MTYKKDSPISPDKWRTRPIQPCISAHDACAPRAASPVPLRASIDVTLYIASPNTLTDSPSLHHSATIIIESSTMPAMSSPIASSPLSSSSSSIGDDDDYDSCFDSDDASHTFTTNNDWSNDEEEVHEEDFDSDTDSDTDMDASAHLTDLALSSTSLSRSFDSVSPDGTLRDLPHWWGEEDSEHTKAILDHYVLTVGIETERKRLVRAAPPFVGRVLRHQVPSVDHLQSLDEVFVYRYEMVPFGRSMPLIRTHWVMTIWDDDSGLPIAQDLLLPIVANTIWLPLSRSSLMSQLLCEPDASSPSQFVFSSSVQRRPLRRSDDTITSWQALHIGYHNACLSWSRFFPECSSSRAFGNDSSTD